MRSGWSEAVRSRRRTLLRQRRSRPCFSLISFVAWRRSISIRLCRTRKRVRWDSLPERQATAEVPAWIEDTGQRVRAKLARCRLPPVLGHADWEAQNIRWLRGEPLAVHDWDSLAWLPEVALVGAAAGVFANHGQPALAPVESSAAFLDAYERARGERFSPYEHEIAWAASTLVALYDARDELIFSRPRLSYERLKAQREERLARAHA